MSVDLISEENLRIALRGYRVDPLSFEAGVRTRIATEDHESAIVSWAGFSPWFKSAATFLPLSLLGCRGTMATTALTPISGGAKLLGYLAFPAISLFVLLGATVLSVLRIRGVQWQTGTSPSEQIEQDKAIRQWWRDHQWGAGAVFCASLALAYYGASSLLFLFYMLSFGIVLYVITTFAKLGIGNRLMIGSSCLQGLMLLGQLAAFPETGSSEIHFLDQSLVPVVFFAGTVAMIPLISLNEFHAAGRMTNWRAAPAKTATAALRAPALFALILLMAWFLYPTVWYPTESRIKNYVESFDHAPFSSVNWQKWEIPASWVVQANLEPDFSKPRELLATEIDGKQDPFILGSAIRVGLLSAGQIEQIKAYDAMRTSVVQSTPNLKPQMITSLDQLDWVIRAAVLRDDLSPAERDVVEQRLHATLQILPGESFVTLVEMLRATQLLDVIQRPVNPQQYRATIHDLLREFHSRVSGGFELSGGFRKYRDSSKGRTNSWTQFVFVSSLPGDAEATAHAIELMTIYGVPDGLDLNWVRSFLRPRWSGDSSRQWVAAVTLDRLNHLQGTRQPTWFEYLYYERTLLAALILVGLCLFATLSSPIPKAAVTSESNA